MRLKYRDNMTPAEQAEFERQIEQTDAAYADSFKGSVEPPADWEDEDAILRRAALNRGQP